MPTSSPPTLYKYLAPERTDVLERNLIRFTQATAFNDPFEALPFAESIFDSGILEKAITKEILERKPDMASLLKLLPHLAGVIRLDWPGAKKIAAKFMQIFIDCQFGCLCLSSGGNQSSLPDNLLMWSHYADCHKGFVLGFDSEHPYFHQERAGKPFFSEITPVTYSLERPRGPIIKDPTALGPVIYHELAHRYFLYKSKHWEYENEWRMIRELKGADQVLSVESEEIHLFSFPAAALRCVVLGCRIEDQVEGKLRDILSEGRYAHVECYRAGIDSADFRLDFAKESALDLGGRSKDKTRLGDSEWRAKLQEAWPLIEKIIERK